MAKKAAKQAQCLVDRQLVGKLRLLQLDADPLAQLVCAGGPVQPQQLHCPCIGSGQPLANFDGGCLARAVRSQQPETLATGDLEVETIDCHYIGKGLAQAAQEKRRAVLMCR